MSSADLVVAVEPLTAVLVVEEAVDVLPAVDVTDPVLRTGLEEVVLVVDPMTERARAVEAVGEVTFLVVEVEAALGERVEGTVDFRVTLGVVELVETTEVRLAMPGVVVALVVPGVAVARVAVVPVLVVVEVTPGVLDALTELVAVGLVAVLVRDVTAGLDVVGAVDVFVMGVFEAEGVLLTGEAGAEVPARPAAAKEDILFLTLGGLFDMTKNSFLKKVKKKKKKRGEKRTGTH
jgi:hypothetical protein